jgi:hypothetical protein
MNKRNALSQHTNHVRDVAEKENCQLPWAIAGVIRFLN